jgi:hypothetical protein
MRKTIIALAGTTALLCGSLVWAAHANSPTSSGASFPHNSPMRGLVVRSLEIIVLMAIA